MMGLYEDFGPALPEDKREKFKAAIAALDGAIKIDSREIAEKLASDNPFVKSAIDSAISKAVESHDAKFKAEKLPSMIDEEIKKRGPKPKDPELAAALERVEALEKAKIDAERETRRITQLSKVLPKITEWGLDADLADRLIGETDADTEALLKKFEKSFVKARDGHTEKILKERFGDNGMPPKGNVAEPLDLQAQFAKAMADGDADRALVLQGQLQAMAGRK